MMVSRETGGHIIYLLKDSPKSAGKYFNLRRQVNDLSASFWTNLQQVNDMSARFWTNLHQVNDISARF
jgi:hypothetical protein